uniref:Fucosyltransferase n=1 Tax=Schistocephalus solidus TaxID=70667 RepID=A0A0X3Q143_SCHSO
MGPQACRCLSYCRLPQTLHIRCLFIMIFFSLLLLYGVWNINLPIQTHAPLAKAKSRTLKLPTDSVLSESTCAPGQTPSLYRNFFRQYAWVQMELPHDVVYSISDTNESLPLIFWDRRILYHPVSSEGCRYRCRYTLNMTEARKAHLAVFTANPPPSILRDHGDTILAFESAEPYQVVAWLSEISKRKISFFITHHTFAAVSAYYGVYRAFKSPNCVMSAEEREALKRQNSLHLLPAHHSQRSKMVAWVVSDMKAFNRRKELADAISKYVLVDTYGKHGMKCQKRWECFKVLSKQYKFYLSFENNNCEGYITEKFFVNALG